MANTFSCLNIHCVFSTKERVWVLDPDIRERLWPYMGGIAKQNGMIPKCIGGVSDHVHLLVTLPTRLAVQLIKAGSSAWIHLGLATPDHTVPSGTALSRDAFPGTSCQATIGVVPTGRACRHFATASCLGTEAA